MKRLGLALIAVLAAGCSAAPTAPSAVGNAAAVVADQDHKPNPVSDTHTITLYFLANGFPTRRPVGMPVDVWSASVPAHTAYVDARGAVTFTIPWTDLSIGFTVPDWNGICGETQELSIPGGSTPVWNHTERLKTGCAVP